MASVHETKDYDDMSMRERGSLALATVLNQEQNIKIV